MTISFAFCVCSQCQLLAKRKVQSLCGSKDVYSYCAMMSTVNDLCSFTSSRHHCLAKTNEDALWFAKDFYHDRFLMSSVIGVCVCVRSLFCLQKWMRTPSGGAKHVCTHCRRPMERIVPDDKGKSGLPPLVGSGNVRIKHTCRQPWVRIISDNNGNVPCLLWFVPVMWLVDWKPTPITS